MNRKPKFNVGDKVEIIPRDLYKEKIKKQYGKVHIIEKYIFSPGTIEAKKRSLIITFQNR